MEVTKTFVFIVQMCVDAFESGSFDTRVASLLTILMSTVRVMNPNFKRLAHKIQGSTSNQQQQNRKKY